ncbi:MAG: B-box zinc finger protein [Myxococcaceae bacterium]
MLRPVFSSAVASEADLVCARLVGAGFHAEVSGARQAGGMFPVLAELTSDVVVPESEFDAARAYLDESKLLLDHTAAFGEVPDGSVCPVHLQPAVAVCERCGTFLCASCGSLGTPPLCEDCVVRAEPARPLPAWVKTTARLWFVFWAGSLVIGALITLALLWSRLTR